MYPDIIIIIIIIIVINIIQTGSNLHVIEENYRIVDIPPPDTLVSLSGISNTSVRIPRTLYV